MKRYLVRWEIDVWADSPKGAAEAAREVQLRDGTIATVFEVTEDETKVSTVIDLDDIDLS